MELAYMTDTEFLSLVERASRIVFTIYSPNGVKDLEVDLKGGGIHDLLGAIKQQLSGTTHD